MANWKERVFPGIPIDNVAFSTDNKIIAVSSKFNVTLCRYKTEEKSISIECSSSVVSVVFTSADDFITATSDGELTAWEIQSDEVVKKNSRRVTAFPVKNVVWSHSKKHSVWITGGEDNSGTDTLSVMMNDRTLEKLDDVPNNLQKDQVAITDIFVVYCYGKNVVKLALDPEEGQDQREVFCYSSILGGLTAEENEKNVFVRIAAHGDTVVASLTIGKVYVWNKLSTKQLALSSAFAIHWHKVSAPMALTPFQGLISAGAETVLCKWSLKNTTAPTLLTRLKAAVTKVVLSEDGSLAALLMEDNSIHIVLLSAMSILCSIPTITHSTRCPQTVFMSDPRVSGTVLMNGTPGWIQWLDLLTGSTLQQACFSLENAVEGNMSDVRFAQTFYQLDNVVLCRESSASLESIVNFPQDHKRLRFWVRTSEHSVEMADIVSVPLDTQFISGCSQSPSEFDNTFIICRTSGSIDTWYPNDEKTKWFKDVARSSHVWQDPAITAVSSVTRGGFWASGHKSQIGECVVVWDVSKMAVVEMFRTDGTLRTLEWASDSLLIVSTSTSVTCWNLNTASPKWIVEQPLTCVVSDLGCFGWENDHVIQFDPSTGGLLDSTRFSSNVESLVAAKLKNKIALIAKTEKGLAVMKSADDSTDSAAVPVTETPFSRLSSIATLGAVHKTPRVRVTTTQNVMKLLDAPCHALPPLSHVAPLFISSCLAPPCDV